MQVYLSKTYSTTSQDIYFRFSHMIQITVSEKLFTVLGTRKALDMGWYDKVHLVAREY
jgi:hypothetical protein